MFHESPPVTADMAGQPQGFRPEAYLNGTSQGATPEDVRKDGHLHVLATEIHKTSGLVVFHSLSESDSSPVTGG